MIRNDINNLPDGPNGMDIGPYLQLWTLLEPDLCKQIDEDLWQFNFHNNEEIICDVISFHGTGTIEDLLKETISNRTAWSYALAYDRNEETFSASVFKDAADLKNNTDEHKGSSSLNPSIALLTAYLKALKFG